MTHFNAKDRHSEQGIALLSAIFTVLLITAIGAGLIMLTNTDTSISANFRDEQTAFFAAKAGIEEVRDRFRSGASGSLTNPMNAFFTTGNIPGASNGVLYITNPAGTETDTPWATTGTAYPDDEICNELTNIGTPCSSGVPTPAGTWYSSTTANASYRPTETTLPWKWVRVTAKTNLSSSGTSSGTTTVTAVDGNTAHTNYRVCWNGSTEVAVSTATCAATSANDLPVYTLTALAVTPSLSRRMVQ